MINYVARNVPVEHVADRLGSHMFVKHCARKDMSSYYELTTALDLPMRTRLLLPHVRTYSAIWLSRTLRKHFFTEPTKRERLISVFWDYFL